MLTNASSDSTDCSFKPTWVDYAVHITHSLGTCGVSAMTVATAITIYLITSKDLSAAYKYQRWLLLYGLGYVSGGSYFKFFKLKILVNGDRTTL